MTLIWNLSSAHCVTKLEMLRNIFRIGIGIKEIYSGQCFDLVNDFDLEQVVY